MIATFKTEKKYSIILLLERETDEFTSFIQTLDETFYALKEPYEILIVANGLEGYLKNQFTEARIGGDHIKALAFNKKTSQAVCLKTALKESTGAIIIACESYQQIKKSSMPLLVQALDEQTDIVSPWRQNRVDPKLNQLQSKIFNRLVKFITGAKLNDLSCTVKIFRREVLEETDIYGNMYRFLPILAQNRGFRYKEVQCEHYKEYGKTGLYSFSEYFNRLIDILTLFFISRYKRKPLRFFNVIGAAFSLIGFIIVAVVFAQKVLYQTPLGNRSVLLFAILMLLIGIQIASIGLLGEVISFALGRRLKDYTIEEII